MAKLDVLKRLDGIESWADGAPSWDGLPVSEMRWLLNLARALLESQGELLAVAKDRCVGLPTNHVAHRIVSRAEKVRKGEV